MPNRNSPYVYGGRKFRTNGKRIGTSNKNRNTRTIMNKK